MYRYDWLSIVWFVWTAFLAALLAYMLVQMDWNTRMPLRRVDVDSLGN